MLVKLLKTQLFGKLFEEKQEHVILKVCGRAP